MRQTQVHAKSVLTRVSGYLRGISSHSLQPYRGCGFGRSLCGVGCYVQHNPWLTRGERWGSFVEARVNAAECYHAQHARERDWARRHRDGFGVFLSSATDPFVPQERRLGVTARLLDAMCDAPPDVLILQTHAPDVVRELPRLRALAARCALRVHLSIESDRDGLPGLPAPAGSVAQRIEAARRLRAAGLRTVVTLAPLLPIRDPQTFFRALSEVADAIVIDHFVGGDGSRDGARTRRTALPAAMERALPGSSGIAYRERVVAIAREAFPGPVGVGRDGFAGRFLG